MQIRAAMIAPNFAPGAAEYIERFLSKEINIFEWGSGGSTIWFAERCKHIWTVEHNPYWYNNLLQEIATSGVKNVTPYFRSFPPQAPYVNAICPDQLFSDRPKFFEVIVVDGYLRNDCLVKALDHAAQHSLIIFDDLQDPQYAPSVSLLASRGCPRKDFTQGDTPNKKITATFNIYNMILR